MLWSVLRKQEVEYSRIQLKNQIYYDMINSNLICTVTVWCTQYDIISEKFFKKNGRVILLTFFLYLKKNEEKKREKYDKFFFFFSKIQKKDH